MTHISCFLLSPNVHTGAEREESAWCWGLDTLSHLANYILLHVAQNASSLTEAVDVCLFVWLWIHVLRFKRAICFHVYKYMHACMENDCGWEHVGRSICPSVAVLMCFIGITHNCTFILYFLLLSRHCIIFCLSVSLKSLHRTASCFKNESTVKLNEQMSSVLLTRSGTLLKIKVHLHFLNVRIIRKPMQRLWQLKD